MANEGYTLLSCKSAVKELFSLPILNVTDDFTHRRLVSSHLFCVC